MGNAKLNSWMQWVLLAGVIVLLFFAFTIYNTPEPEPIVIPTYDIPTAQEIADLIVIPDTPATFLSLRQTLKTEAVSVCDDEFDFDDVEDLFDDDFDVDLVREYIEDREYSRINVGLDYLDDRTITIHREYKVRVDDDYSDRVYTTCEVTSDDGDLEADITYRL